MIKFPEKPTVYFDVDNTLIFAESDISSKTALLLPSVCINSTRFFLHDIHIEKPKEFKARGHVVVVWSAGGADWAEMVVSAAGLRDYVDVVIAKPAWYFDDLVVTDWIGKHCYVPVTFNKEI